MTKILMALAITLGIGLASYPIIKITSSQLSKEIKVTQYVKEKIPRPFETLNESEPIKVQNVKKIITLEEKNTVVFRGPVTTDSVSKVMGKLRKISRSIPAKSPIYLVLDTPGGSVFDGTAFIDFAKALPQKVNTITLFAASMGFQIAQNLDTRYITPNGTLMSHRARGGVNGQFDGELESRYKMIKRVIDYLDYKAAKRMGIKLSVYKKMIKPEYWVHGFDAEQDGAADQQVLLRCGKSLDGVENFKLQTFFGSINAKFSKCPLIKAPVSVNFSNEKNKEYLNYLYNISFIEKRKFIKDMIDNDQLGKNFRIR